MTLENMLNMKKKLEFEWLKEDNVKIPYVQGVQIRKDANHTAGTIDFKYNDQEELLDIILNKLQNNFQQFSLTTFVPDFFTIKRIVSKVSLVFFLN